MFQHPKVNLVAEGAEEAEGDADVVRFAIVCYVSVLCLVLLWVHICVVLSPYRKQDVGGEKAVVVGVIVEEEAGAEEGVNSCNQINSFFCNSHGA